MPANIAPEAGWTMLFGEANLVDGLHKLAQLHSVQARKHMLEHSIAQRLRCLKYTTTFLKFYQTSLLIIIKNDQIIRLLMNGYCNQKIWGKIS